ncbi:RagB/SusD family nutrient uptake outer membrane protein [Flavitalea sp. BT771]|uniref:RagB/SusD family nutrient uptake outer membrane protein n=1 Tax=Flavitalea sp. BT771 TaxID=3063329 RepID=UPI0026E2D994|nr:RagB/SusD family nutrient uptake outer membrane protein [Flavitalea sp. BT771]MDO6429616.1 RagB/SusD family nutrient uptake outer membrane protein [Flavitalea sp. BT771]MDV6218256.1 RagB/SusD family nutrient uptake outer membrane protein [Flavitalea sp. BT771]
MNNKARVTANIALCCVLFFASCRKYLDQVPNDRINMDEVFKKQSLSEQFLANIYSNIIDEGDPIHNHPYIGTADDIDFTWSGGGTLNYAVNVGNMGRANLVFDFWQGLYGGIRSASYFMQHVDENDEIRRLHGQDMIDRYKAEARFLRAYFYFSLMRQYGPVILMGDKVIAPDAPAAQFQLARSPWDSCVDYVVKELDEVSAQLPIVAVRDGNTSDADYGRATKGMALAVKARLLLYAASPQYNGNTDALLANFKTGAGTPLISPDYDPEKWRKAADAAKAVIDMGIYSLYKDPSGDPIKSLQGIFSQGWNAEQIFVRKGNGLITWDVHCEPRQAGGWSGVGPTQEMVDSYFMSDGKLPTESSLYAETGFTDVGGQQIYNMYLNREPRFYRDVTYNNSTWQGGTMSRPAPVTFYANGPNGRNGHPTDWTKTGYLCRKNVAPQTNVGSGGNGQQQQRPLALFRLAEIYLDYAEALNEIDPGNSDILKYLNMIRERAGIPLYGAGVNPLPIPASQTEMRKRIWAERKVELAYEGHRFFDIRRWKIAPQVMGVLHGMDITKNDNSFYTRVPTITPHLFLPSYYWWPISQYELDRDRVLIENPGY